MRTNQPGHLKTFDYRGVHRYSLTLCTDCRRRVFVEAVVVTLVAEQILRGIELVHLDKGLLLAIGPWDTAQ